MVRRVTRQDNVVNSHGDDHAHHLLWTNQIPHISSQESSESEFVEEEKPWPPSHRGQSRTITKQVTQLLPRPHSHLFRRGPGEGQARGSRHSRRWENSAYLSSLHPICEDDESVGLLPEHHSAFTTLHTSSKHMQIWTSFSARSEEEQRKMLQGDRVSSVACVSRAPPSPVDCFSKIDKRIQSVLRHNRHLPLDLVASLEEELCWCFSLDPQTVLLSLQRNSFSRLLVHGLCQYMGLQSTTLVSGDSNIVVVISQQKNFTQPQTLLSQYMKTR